MEVQLAQLPQQLRQLFLLIKIHAVAGDVLRDDDALLHAAVRQRLGLGQNVLHPAAAVLAPQGGNDAVGAAVAAPLGDAEVGVVHGSGDDPRQLLHRGVYVGKMAVSLSGGHLFHGGNDVAVAAGAHDAVHLRKLLQKLRLITLTQAAGDQNFAHLPRCLQLRHRQNRLNGLQLGAVDEAAGVHHHHVAAGAVLLHRHAALQAQGHHLLGVHPVFVTSKGYK